MATKLDVLVVLEALRECEFSGVTVQDCLVDGERQTIALRSEIVKMLWLKMLEAATEAVSRIQEEDDV